MQKSSFFTLVIIAITAATMPIIGMDLSEEKPTYIFTLPSPCVLSKKSADQTIPEAYRKYNEATCKILHINHQKNDDWLTTQYLNVHYQIGHNDTKKYLEHRSFTISDFTDNAIDIETCSKCFEQYKTLKRNVQFLFPTQLPRIFIEQLEKEKSITHELEKCTVIFQLDNTPTTQRANKDIREGVKNITGAIEVITSSRTKSTSNSSISYLIFGGLTASIIGFIALLIYKHR